MAATEPASDSTAATPHRLTASYHGRCRGGRPMRHLLLLCLALPCAPAANAQLVIEDTEYLAFDQPEAWAMGWVDASTLMTGFGETPALAAWDWQLAGELGHIPRLDAEQQRVGLGGSKQEDLNKSPVFGRLRGWLGLAGGFVAELGWTPPLELDGVRARELVAVALARRLVAGERWSWSARLHGQHGRAGGDISCAADLVGAADADNPFGCVAPSDDRIRLNHYGLDSTAAWTPAPAWRAHASLGLVRAELEAQVNATLESHIDRTRLVTRGTLRYAALGATRRLSPDWSIASELLYVPLHVRREVEGDRGNDAFWSLRIALQYHP